MSRSSDRGHARWISPFFVVMLIVALVSLLAAPVGYFFDPRGYFRYFNRNLSDESLWHAYGWTVYAIVVLVVLHVLLGCHRHIRAFQQRPFQHLTDRQYWWIIVGLLAIGTVCLGVMYRQAGWRVPVLMAAGGDYEAYAALRMEFYALVHQTFFNTSLYFVATPAVLISWYCLRRNPWTARLLSLALFAAVSSFTLDRSPVGLALLMMLNFHLLTRPITRTQFVVGATGAISVIAAAHFLAGEPAGYAGRIDYLLVRVFYGQWMGLPFFFETFAQQRESLTALLPRALQTWFGEEAISPARSVMFLLAPEAVERGTAGVASAFFLGDAWAVGGVLGVLLAPLVVTAQIWVASLAFRLLPTNFFTSAVYSWFWFKLLMGILSGFSAFVSSALQAVLLVVVYAAVVRQLALAGRSRGSRPALQP